MEKGFYLSTFLAYGELENIYGIKLRHDQTVALWEYDGKIIKLIRYWELERISGIKEHPITIFDKKATINLIEDLLKKENVSLKDIKAIWGTKGIETDTKYREQFLNSNICFHNIAHLLSSIFYNNSTPLSSNIIGLAMDAGPDSQFEEDAYEKDYYSGCIIKDGKMEIFNIQSPARLWSYSRKRFKLQEGTLMALATATKTEYYCEMEDFKEFKNAKLLNETSREYAQKIVEEIIDKIFGLTEDEIGIKCSEFDNKFSDEENKISMVMKIIEKMSEKIVSQNIDFIIQKYKINTKEFTLAMAGGFALNCPTNSFILEKYGFMNYQIPPCTSDTGISIGIGLAGFYETILDKKIRVSLDTAYYGMNCGNIDVIAEKYYKYIESISSVSIEDIVNDIINDKIIIWINGNAEIGPRALGNRSLIGDPRSLETKKLLNQIKKRQWWRPVAPIVMDDEGKKYFENYRYSPYMLLNLKIKQEQKNKVPAIIHIDDTARIQSIRKNDNTELYSLISNFYLKTNIPILCNTSLNDSGEPIINSIEQAIEFALHKNIKAVYVNGKYKISLKKHKEQIGKKFNLRIEKYFKVPEYINNIEEIKILKNPYGLNLNELTYYFDNPNRYGEFDITNENDVNKIRRDTEEYMKKFKNALVR